MQAGPHLASPEIPYYKLKTTEEVSRSEKEKAQARIGASSRKGK